MSIKCVSIIRESQAPEWENLAARAIYEEASKLRGVKSAQAVDIWGATLDVDGFLSGFMRVLSPEDVARLSKMGMISGGSTNSPDPAYSIIVPPAHVLARLASAHSEEHLFGSMGLTPVESALSRMDRIKGSVRDGRSLEVARKVARNVVKIATKSALEELFSDPNSPLIRELTPHREPQAADYLAQTIYYVPPMSDDDFKMAAAKAMGCSVDSIWEP